MTPRERVLRAFRRGDGLPDRVPFQFDLCRSLIDHFSNRLGVDPAFAPQQVSENVATNEFGMHMKPTDLYVEIVKAPLQGVAGMAEIEEYTFPDPHAPGRFEAAGRDVERLGKEYFVIGGVEISIFELAWHMTGMETYLLGTAAEEPWVEALNDRVEEWSMGLATALADLGVDGIWFGEDLGTQTSTLISPNMWRRMFRPHYERMIAALRERHPDLIIIMHSDGAVAPLLEDFIDMSIDVYNPVQPNVPGSDPRELKDRYGARLCFFGGIDQQALLPSGDEKSIREEMARRARILGDGGGYLMAPAHIIQADVSPRTVEIMCDAAVSG